MDAPSIIETYKTCSKCGCHKPISEFHKAISCKGGTRPDCKSCHWKWYSEYKTGRRIRIPVSEQTEKKCKICLRTLPVDKFHRRQRFAIGTVSVCKICSNKRSAEYCRKKEAESPGWKKNRGRKRNLKKNYGLSQEAYNSMLASCGGVCPICNDSMTGRFVHVDHDHKTNAVRGLVCGGCNVMLGMSRDNAETLRKAIEYLERFKNAETQQTTIV